MLAVGVGIAAVAAGGPIAAGAALTVVVGDTSWDRGVWYATLGYAGGVGSAVVSLVVTGNPIAVAVGAVVAAPAALCGLAIDQAVQSGWGTVAS